MKPYYWFRVERADESGAVDLALDVSAGPAGGAWVSTNAVSTRYALTAGEVAALFGLILTRRYVTLAALFELEPHNYHFRRMREYNGDTHATLAWNAQPRWLQDDRDGWLRTAQTLLLLLLRTPAARFWPVDFTEPSLTNTIEIMRAAAPSRERYKPVDLPLINRRKMSYSTIIWAGIVEFDPLVVRLRVRLRREPCEHRSSRCLRCSGSERPPGGFIKFEHARFGFRELCRALVRVDTPAIARMFGIAVQFSEDCTTQRATYGGKLVAALRTTPSRWATLVDHILLALIQDERTRGYLRF